VLWLLAAKEKWLAGDVPAARLVLERAFDMKAESEQIWLTVAKLEAENNELNAARALLVRARTIADTERVCTLAFDEDFADNSYSTDMDEIGRLRTATRRNIHRFRYAVEGSSQVPEIRKILHDTRSNTPVAGKLPCCTSFICRRTQGMSKGDYIVGPRQQALRSR
jgi:hypothetical protein